MKESKIPTTAAGINSFNKALEMKEVLRFLCQWSTEGARAVFNLVRSLGEKECLTKCQFSKNAFLGRSVTVPKIVAGFKFGVFNQLFGVI